MRVGFSTALSKITLTLCFVVAVSQWGRCDQPAGAAFAAQLLIAEGVANSNGLEVNSGNVVVKTGRPGVAFACVTTPGQSKTFAYFLIFNHDFPKALVTSQGTSDGSIAKTNHTISAFGHRCEAEYRVTLRPGQQAVASVETRVGGVRYDLTKGKVFLLEMKNAKPSVTQLNIELPTKLPRLDRTSDVEKFAERTLKRLREANEAVNAFCQASESGA